MADTDEQIPLTETKKEESESSETREKVIPKAVLYRKIYNIAPPDSEYPLDAHKYFNIKIKEPEQTCFLIINACPPSWCSLWCGVHFWLFILILIAITDLVLYSLMFTILKAPNGTYLRDNCDVETDEYGCDYKIEFESSGYDKGPIITGLTISSIGLVINALTFCALHKFNRYLLLLQLVWILIHIIWDIILIGLVQNYSLLIVEMVVLAWSSFVLYSVYKWMKIGVEREEESKKPTS